MEKDVYKSSQYNIFFEDKAGVTLLYNTFTTALIKLTKEKAEKIKITLKLNDLNELETDEYNLLINNGFIINNKINEIDQVKFRYYRGVFNSRDFRVTIVPTLNCNLNCPYCFERDKRDENITLKEYEEIYKFIDKQLFICQPNDFGISWYGGEPLLEVDTIENISNKIDIICKNNNIKRACDSIVTNGYLLDEDCAKRLFNCGIKKIQITLDGDRDAHNKQRILKNGEGTFDKILNSIIIAQRYFELVTVRFNTNKSNHEGIVRLLKNKSDIFNKNNIVISVGRLKNYLGGIVSKENDNDCLNGFELQNIQGYIDNYYKRVKTVNKMPIQIKHTNCGAESHKCFIIGPKLKIYKCAEALGYSDSVGFIVDGDFQPNEVFWQWFNYNIFNNNEKCMSCKYVPMCMGGCPSSRKRLGIPNNEICGYWEQWLNIKFNELINTLN
ncbi:MAG: hypothetical protein A2509_06390 [Candidatus Edwardsbacteria bacterium RIFOXYD12_FULL_50_11]|uniref:Radical SAM core domain-containing protein n=1 Tax=Candidatus Edwardsbacteria bacterium GWF2_54_11 TaxID=1817851 RepID=A0A1F5R4A2_9BACT|nr:MAG: hypothetical protein A2502_10225 [Candidatus Edwardsbacteria bacterium RifOxyC12_full_54_24]OGF06786.1 MAG: hypothetical protein A2273_00835 [Candidatus Edwardsbacteria bacterium RifOxyA12_full_54_48]OGF08853.1 MAG: hypothetical protein A2024_01095 [Candidatus Edwardsbacteria bacterium GWF2_54_11]OGF10736.1 MAG: hypothetical protein A3K15_06200 [Candidatus Edwardsbacteria bacterium GWE2_54_12]OGF15516.1 MAG: hypothetical protein A2509_06390 [Candidatus Edwardsbacteria bacterium RIFOXYD1